MKAGLTRILTHNIGQVKDVKAVEITLNIDGLPMFHSSSYSLWPVLCCVANVTPSQVFPVALYGGKAKPANMEFLSEAVHELGQLLNDGIIADGRHFRCVLKLIICDAPARCMVKCSKQYSGYFRCDKCCQKGEYVGIMTYPDCEAPSPDDESFRSQSNMKHHNGISPFCQLPIDMIQCFPIDYMHQTCLGVMKRLLACWTGGSRKFRLSVTQKAQINTRLQVFRQSVTSDFSRKPRPLDDLAHWKATEFRTFLLYTGYFALHKIVSDDSLAHFLSLVVAMRIFTSEKLAADSDNRSFAHKLPLHFVSHSADIYGREFLVYNVHCLVHLCHEVEMFGHLDNCSAFAFENHMQTRL